MYILSFLYFSNHVVNDQLFSCQIVCSQDFALVVEGKIIWGKRNCGKRIENLLWIGNFFWNLFGRKVGNLHENSVDFYLIWAIVQQNLEQFTGKVKGLLGF